MVKQAALDRDFSSLAPRKINPQFLAADGNKFHGVEGRVRTLPNFLLEFESLQHRPTGRIDTITADFFAWKFFPLQNERSQSCGRAKRRAGGTGRPAADNRYIDNLHSASV